MVSWGQFLTSPLGAKFGHKRWTLSPRVAAISQGWRPSVRPFVLLNIKEGSFLGLNKGENNPPGDKVHSWGAKFAPGGQLMLLKTGLWRAHTCIRKKDLPNHIFATNVFIGERTLSRVGTTESAGALNFLRKKLVRLPLCSIESELCIKMYLHEQWKPCRSILGDNARIVPNRVAFHRTTWISCFLQTCRPQIRHLGIARVKFVNTQASWSSRRQFECPAECLVLPVFMQRSAVVNTYCTSRLCAMEEKINALA
jgi:hypothetical protein